MPLAIAVAQHLGSTKVHAIQTEMFSNGQIGTRLPVALTEADVVLFQAFADDVHRRLFELLLAIDLARAGGARRVTVVMPHLPYSRSDRPAVTGEPVAARMLAAIIEHIGISRLITVELHTPQISGFFRCPVTNIDFMQVLACYLDGDHATDWIVVSPDLGGAKRAERLAAAMKCPMALVLKHREHGVRRGVEVLGNVTGKAVLLVDDEINSGQTLISAAELLRSRGAKRISLAVAHALFTSDAADRLPTAGFDRVIVSDSSGSGILPNNVEIVSIASEIAASL